MRRTLSLSTAALALALGCTSDQPPTAPATVVSAPGIQPHAAVVSRFRFFHEGFFVHTIPDRGIAFTIGLLTPVEDLCNGLLIESDIRGTSQTVSTPAGSIKLLDRVKGTFVLYDAVLQSPDEFCNLATAPIIGVGRGTFTRTDNSLTGVGPGINSFGVTVNAVLDLTDGGKALLHIVGRFLFDGVNFRVLVDKVELKRIGK